MPGFATLVPHRLGAAVATDRLKSFLEAVRRDHADKITDLRGQWEGHRLNFAFAAYGMPIEGSLLVEELGVHVSGKLPLAAALFRGQIEKTIRDELAKLLT